MNIVMAPTMTGRRPILSDIGPVTIDEQKVPTAYDAISMEAAVPGFISGASLSTYLSKPRSQSPLIAESSPRRHWCQHSIGQPLEEQTRKDKDQVQNPPRMVLQSVRQPTRRFEVVIILIS